MPVTVLDPCTALIVIDLQKGIVSLPAAHPMADIIARCCALAEAFRAHRLPVVLVNVDPAVHGRADQAPRAYNLPAGFTDFIPELNQQPEDHVATKRNWGAFINTGLAGYLQSKSVTQVVIVGVATSIGVESTARQAHELDLNVTLATDAMTDMRLEAHNNSVNIIFPRIAETGTTDEIITLLNATR
jgi:nicotinamidase-related amidase